MRSRQCRLNSSKRREGAAFLLLVMMLLLIVAASTQALITNSANHRRGEVEWVRSLSMDAALNQAASIQSDWSETLQFPVNDQLGELIEVAKNQERSTITARWLRGSTELARRTRPLESTESSTESP